MTRTLLILALLSGTLPAQLITFVSDSKGNAVTNGGKGIAGKGLIRIHVPHPLPPDTTVRLFVICGDDEKELDLIAPRGSAAIYHSRPGKVIFKLFYESPTTRVERSFTFTATKE